MRVFGRILGITFALIIALLAGAAYVLQDANRLKPELESLIAKNSDYTAKINGDIQWDLWPPLHLMVEDLSLTHDDEHIQASSLDLKMDLSAIWEDMDKWQVTELHLRDTVLKNEETSTTLNQLDVQNFRFNEPADFFLDVSYLGKQKGEEEVEPIAATLDGILSFHPATEANGQRITLRDTKISADIAKGVCQADITDNGDAPITLPEESDDDVLPLSTLLTYNIGADCVLSELTLGTETFHDSTVEITNLDGLLNIMLDVKDFLGGTMLTDIDVDVSQQPTEWTVLPEIKDVDSQRLIDWTKQRMQWIAPIALNSTIRMSGNTEAELANSIQAQSEFDGGQGQLNIAKIKEQLLKIATYTQKSDEVAEWPDLWNYQQFTGLWNITGPTHNLNFVLDNMNVEAQGDYDYVADTIDMLAHVTINEAPEDSPFRINPILEGTPLPVRCTGSAADPKCRLDQGATQTLIARALQSGDDSGLRKKLEQKIDEKVPEEYRDTARSILDLLGKALEKE